jgi:hypothetical protein
LSLVQKYVSFLGEAIGFGVCCTKLRPSNKATGADGRFKAFVARFALDCVSVAAAHWQALG